MPDTSAAESPKIAELKRRLAADPTSRLFVELAREYHEAGAFAEAAVVCERGLKKHPGYLSARTLLGRIYFDSGRVEEARDQMESVLSQVPDNLIARRVLAEISLEAGDLSGAMDRYRALLAFNAADTEARRKVEELEARMHEGATPAGPSAASPTDEPRGGGGSGGPGGAALEPGVLATPTLAEIYLTQGQTDMAVQVYQEILRGDPGNKEVAARLAELRPDGAGDDPAGAVRRRKIDTLASWLRVIQGRAGD